MFGVFVMNNYKVGLKKSGKGKGEEGWEV